MDVKFVGLDAQGAGRNARLQTLGRSYLATR